MKRVLWLLLLLSNIGTGTTFKELLADYQPAREKPIVIVITSYNNKEWYQRNLASVFNQRYTNYRVIYIDDHSPDQTAELVKAYVTQQNQWHRFTLIANEEWASQMVNHIKAVYLCADNEIVVHMDGDDWFSYDGALELINKIYSKWDVWITYGQYQSWPQNEIGGSRPVPEAVIKSNGYREFGFYYSHPRTFYASLFKKIKLKDLLYKGSFIPTAPCPDLMFMFPMLEMAGMHALFIPDVLYRWNRINAVSQHNIPVKKDLPPVESWDKSLPLAGLHQNNRMAKQCIALICSDNYQQARAYVERAQMTSGISEFIILEHHQALKIDELLKDVSYVLLVTDLGKELPTDLPGIMQTLDDTGAHGFFFGLDGSHFNPCNEPINYAPFKGAFIQYRNAPVFNGMLAWQMEYEIYIWQDSALLGQLLFAPSNVSPDFYKALCDGRYAQAASCLKNSWAQNRNVALMYESND